MARQLRIEFEGAFYHVIARGNARNEIFVDDKDRQAFVTNLGRVSGRFEWRVWAWCLMSNHYHLLIETLQPSLSRGMREINGVYTQGFNRRHDRVGHVLQGRYKSVLVEKDSYLLELSRYLVLNPVRAGMVDAAGDWPWSSYRAVMGHATAPEWLAVDDTLSLFAAQRGRARQAYARFVTAGVDTADPMDQQPRAGFLGSETFVEQVYQRLNTTKLGPEIARKSRPAPSLARIVETSVDRNDAIRRAYETRAYSLTQIARHFDVHLSTASRIAKGENARNKT